MTLAPFRALIINAVDDGERVIEGVASSSAPDRAGDQLLSRGAVFDLPMPLLMQHDRKEPVGQVTPRWRVLTKAWMSASRG
jgi:hypothetical protein